MNLMNVYEKIENHLLAIYKISPHDRETGNLVKCRAVKLTQLYLLVYKHANTSFIRSSHKISLSELIYTASGKLIAEPQSVPPALVLLILEEQLNQLANAPDNLLVGVENKLKEWLFERLEWHQQLCSGLPTLPELRWSDLPNELFGLKQES
ncbi:Uncharacterised protein [Escherichia coli]|uniref:Uncharacterized protein n=1 Tax=Escherichia coli TaxID=562 RepID=A0A376JNX7_ECOLX|nr:Uncharacterised protein [Escherichia coli]